MSTEQRTGAKYAPVKPMTAAERYAYKSLLESLRRRKESVDDTVVRILEFLDLVKEVGEEISVLGSTPYSPEGSGTYDPEHVAEREELLGHQFWVTELGSNLRILLALPASLLKVLRVVAHDILDFFLG